MNVQTPIAAPERAADPREARRLIREGAHTGHTAGLAPGYLQGNLVILPAAHALDFFRFCQRNPKPCPLVGVSDTGNPDLFTLGTDVDIRTDVPSYNIFRDGVLTELVPDITDLWGGELGRLRDRLLLHLRAGAGNRRDPPAPLGRGHDRLHVPH
ncbi:MAG: hypothetical protein ACMVO3_20560 [Thalassobaculum sp.]